MFRTSVPVTSESFLDRKEALARLTDLTAKLKAGAPIWLCILGPRKVGKTSLLLEVERRTADPSLLFVVLDAFEAMPVSVEIFRRGALRVVDAALGADLGVSLEALAGHPAEYRAALQRSKSFAELPSPLRADVLELPEHPLDDRFLRACLDLPERLATALGLSVMLAIDEFQELGGPIAGRKDGELLPLVRSVWQRHRRVAYVVSGSAPTMLTELVTREHSPFFQHFALMELGPFPSVEAERLLVENAPEDRPITPALAARIVEVIGGHPFYLQLLGEVLTAFTPPYDERSLKDALQELLFSRTGRLALYFENEFDRLVGRSTFLSATLQTLAEGPQRLSALAKAIRTPSGATVRYLERLGDAVTHRDGLYALRDPLFGHWLAWRRPGGSVVPMRLIGDLAEQEVADRLARSGFELVYQSRASRGAFDLLATRGPHQLGVQVKRADLPLHIDSAAWGRMVAEGKRLAWHWIVAAVMPPPDGRVLLLDPKRAKRTKRGVSLGEGAVIDNLLLWLDEKASIRRAALRSSGRGG